MTALKTAIKGFRGRAFVALLTTFSFLVVVATGLVLFIEPHGRIAYWTDWRLLGLGKQHWDAIHLTSTLLFLVASIFHIYFNWKPLLCYLKGTAQQSTRYLRELALSAALVLVFVVGSIVGFQPFGAFLDLNERIKTSWTTTADEQPPFGHAEMASLAALCRSQRLELEVALGRLRARGFQAASGKQTVKELAEQYNTTPREIFAVLRGEGQQSAPVVAAGRRERQLGPQPSSGGPSAQQLFQRYAGRGLGRVRFDTLCSELGLELEPALARLRRQGITARADQTLKAVAQSSGLRPADVLAILCQEGGCR